MTKTILLVGSTIIALFMAVMMNIVRTKVARKPTSVKRIILPPIMMSTGAFMFIFPVFRVGLVQFVEALLLGVVFSLILIKFTKFEIKDDEIYLIPSKLFIFILFGLMIIRLTIKVIIGTTISFGETSGLFFILALGMMLSWRIAMLIKYHRLKLQLKTNTNNSI